MLLAVRTQRDAATMVGLIAAATGLVTLYGCLRLAPSAPESMMIYDRLGWPTGYPNTSAALGVLAFWTSWASAPSGARSGPRARSRSARPCRRSASPCSRRAAARPSRC